MDHNNGNIIDSIIHASFTHRALVIMAVALAVVFGASAFQKLPRNVYPDITIPIFTIMTENEGMAPEEIEAMITRPMESAMNGLPGVRRIRSQSTQGLSSVVVEFDINIEFWRARQFVTERMSQVIPILPPETEPPTLQSATTRMAEVYEYAVEGELPAVERREIAEWQIRYSLLTVPGVADVLNMGGYLRQYRVSIDPIRLKSYGVSLSEVEEAVKAGNENSSGSFISTGPTEYNVRGIGRYETLEDIQNTVVAEKSGFPIYLKDVADVAESTAIRRGIASKNGKEAVVAIVMKQQDADTVTVVRAIEKAIAEMNDTLPDGARIVPYYSQTHLINESLRSVTYAILIGAVLVVIILLLLLGHFRSTLIVAASLPLSVLIAGSIMHRLGVGLNTMSLGGLAIAVGIMVDASIIMVENVYHRMHKSRAEDAGERTEVAKKAALEVGKPIAFATLIIIAVFLPLFIMGGVEGLLFRPLSLTVAAAMLVSMLVSLTLTPILSARFLRASGSDPDGEVGVIKFIKRGYIPALDWAFAHPWLTRGIAIAITLPAIIAFFSIGRDFMPKLNEGAWLISIATPPETSLEENYRMTSQIDDLLNANPNIQDVIRRSGRAERAIGCALPVNLTEFTVNLKPRKQLSKPPDQILKDVREQIDHVPGIASAFSQPFQMKVDEGLEGTPAPLQVKLFGPDVETLVQKGKEIEEIVRATSGITDVNVPYVSGVPQIQVKIDRQAAARYGVSVGKISEIIRLAVGGEELTQVWKDQRSYGVFVRFKDEYRGDIDAIGNVPVDIPSGATVPLSQVAEVSLTEGPNVIWREAMNRRISIDAGIQGRDLAGVVSDIREGINKLNLPKGYFVVFGGQYQNQQRAMRSLILATLVALFVVFMLLFMALGRASDAFVILATLPDAFVGGILALLIAGESLNVSSGVGFIALFGIAVQNGLVLLTQTRDLELQGLSKLQAVRQASIGRLRPKLMTALCAALGVIPMLLSGGVGAEIEKPLAIVLVGGLVTSTIFTLLVLPTVYLLAEQIRLKLGGKPKKHAERQYEQLGV